MSKAQQQRINAIYIGNKSSSPLAAEKLLQNKIERKSPKNGNPAMVIQQ